MKALRDILDKIEPAFAKNKFPHTVFDGLSTFLFLSGLYCYLYGRHLAVQTLMAGTLWAGVYFSNYRMIILPLAIFVVEICLKGKFHGRRFVYSLLVFNY